MTKLTVAFSNFAKTPKKECVLGWGFFPVYRIKVRITHVQLCPVSKVETLRTVALPIWPNWVDFNLVFSPEYRDIVLGLWYSYKICLLLILVHSALSVVTLMLQKYVCLIFLVKVSTLTLTSESKVSVQTTITRKFENKHFQIVRLWFLQRSLLYYLTQSSVLSIGKRIHRSSVESNKSNWKNGAHFKEENDQDHDVWIKSGKEKSSRKGRERKKWKKKLNTWRSKKDTKNPLYYLLTQKAIFLELASLKRVCIITGVSWTPPLATSRSHNTLCALRMKYNVPRAYCVSHLKEMLN